MYEGRPYWLRAELILLINNNGVYFISNSLFCCYLPGFCPKIDEKS